MAFQARQVVSQHADLLNYHGAGAAPASPAARRGSHTSTEGVKGVESSPGA